MRLGNLYISPPFPVKSGRVCFIPENLGFEEKPEDIAAIIDRARLFIMGFEDPTLAFFWHPHLGVQDIRKIIQGLLDITETLERPIKFVAPGDLLNSKLAPNEKRDEEIEES